MVTCKALDTNIILSDASSIEALALDGSVIVLPETVIHELDSKKSGFEDINFQAREFARFMTTLQHKDTITINTLTITVLTKKDLEVHIVSSSTPLATDISIPPSILNDQKIITTTQEYARAYASTKSVTFLSLDLMCRIGAKASGLATAIPEVKAPTPLQLLKQIKVESSLFNSLEGKSITDYDPEHELGNFSYEFLSSDGNSERAIIEHGIIKLLREDEFKKLAVKPINMKQKLWCKALLSDRYELNILEAKAGTGKNLTSLTCAMRLIDENPKYDKIVYIRNSIESIDKGADVGYLPGLEEKFRIYNMPLHDTVEYIAKASVSGKNPSREAIDEKVTHIMGKYAIETLWPGEARGRTLSNAIVIMDEWQNSSNNTTQLILSRLDDTCKAIVIGSNRQIDNPYLNRHNNGLTSLLNDLPAKSSLEKFSITLDKAVRGKFAEFAENLFEG